jgi:hypothetical protein
MTTAPQQTEAKNSFPQRQQKCGLDITDGLDGFAIWITRFEWRPSIDIERRTKGVYRLQWCGAMHPYHSSMESLLPTFPSLDMTSDESFFWRGGVLTKATDKDTKQGMYRKRLDYSEDGEICI